MPEIRTKIVLPLLLTGICSIMCSCGNVNHSSDVVDVPSNQYLVLGEVKKPGYVSCNSDKPKTLLELLSEAGDFTDYAITKDIMVIHSGVTNKYDFKLIKTGKSIDPAVTCGSKIVIRSIRSTF